MTSSLENRRGFVYSAQILQQPCILTVENGQTPKVQVVFTPKTPIMPWKPQSVMKLMKSTYAKARKSPHAFISSNEVSWLNPAHLIHGTDTPSTGDEIMKNLLTDLATTGEKHISFEALTKRFQMKLKVTPLLEVDRLAWFKTFLNSCHIVYVLSDKDFSNFAAATVGFTGAAIRNICRAVDELNESRKMIHMINKGFATLHDPITGKDLMLILGNRPPNVAPNWEDILRARQ